MKGLLHEDLHRLIDMTSKKIKNSGCRDGAGGESTGYFARGLEFNSQHLHPAAYNCLRFQLMGDPVPSSGPNGHPHIHRIHTHRQTHSYMRKKKCAKIKSLKNERHKR